MLLASLFYLLHPAYAGTNCILNVHYQNYPDVQAKFEGYSENTDEFVAAFESKEEANLKFASYLVFNGIKINHAKEEKLIVTIGGDGKNTVMHRNLYVDSWVIQPTQAEIEAERLSKIEADIEDANKKLSQLNSNIAEATIRISKLNSDPETNYKSNNDVTDNPFEPLSDSNRFSLIDYGKKKKNKYRASVLALGVPVITAGVICAGFVAVEDIRMSSAINQPIKSLYDGHDYYDPDGLQTNWEWSDETKADHKKLGTAGAFLGGTGLIITALAFAW